MLPDPVPDSAAEAQVDRVIDGLPFFSIAPTTGGFPIPITLRAGTSPTEFDGSFTIRRGDFSIGEGAWAKFDIVANDVLIKFRITAASK